MLFCIIAGIKTRLSCILTFVLLIVAQSFHFSFGKIDHATLLTLTYLALACTNSGCEYTLIKDKELSKRYQNIGIAIFSICIAFGLFTAGFPKLISWVDFDLSTNGILSWYYQGFYSLERQRFLAPFVPHVPMILMEMGDYFAVFLELSGFFFLIKGKTYWRVWLLVLSFFHLMNVLILNIPFLGHIVVYGLFVLPPFFRSIIVDRKMASSIWLAGVVAGTVLAGFRLYEQWFNLKFEPFFGAEIASIFLWAGMFVITGMVIWQERPTRAQDMQMQGIYHGEKS